MKPNRRVDPRLRGDDIAIVHTLADCHAALAAGHTMLQSAPDAAYYAGCDYLLTLFETAAARYPHAGFIVDCGEDAHLALQAMRAGHRFLKFHAEDNVSAKISKIAEQIGAIVIK